jgi:hypothetical protein
VYIKKHFNFLAILVLIPGIVLFSAYSGEEGTDYPGGSPAGYTGSPYDGKDCQYCHGGTSQFVEGWITSDIPAEGYTPGNSYTITVTVTGSGEKGFEVSPHDLNGNLLGTLSAGTGNKLVGSGKYVTQSASSTSNPATWNFTWTAPPAGTGEVTFWGAFTVNKPVTKTSILVVQELIASSLTVEASAEPNQICTGDSSHLTVTVSGGTGAYAYAWTSNPPGFSSGLQDLWVFPLETTTYYVIVDDGISTGTDSTEVTVFCLGSSENGGDLNRVVLYPNPFKDGFRIVLSNPESRSVTLTLTGLSGRVVYREVLRLTGDVNTYFIGMNGCNPGIYILTLSDGVNQFTEKVLKTE